MRKRKKYTVHSNDLIGGWIVSEHGKPASQHDFERGEREVCETYSIEEARRVAEGLNLLEGRRQYIPSIGNIVGVGSAYAIVNGVTWIFGWKYGWHR